MNKIWGKRVLLPDGWSYNTLVEMDDKGKIKDIQKNIEPKDQVFDTLIPSPMNLHSHCFQRAMNGLSERSQNKSNDFSQQIINWHDVKEFIQNSWLFKKYMV